MTSSDDFLELCAGQYRAQISPFGGGLWSLTFAGKPLVVTPPLPHQGLSQVSPVPFAAGCLLAPWPNRVDSGNFAFQGETYQLEINEPDRHNAIHGFVRERPWELDSETSDNPAAVCLTLEMEPQPGWPWRLKYVMNWSLDATQGLRGELQVSNLSDTPCPFGFGWHPYLSAGGASLDECTLSISVGNNLVLDSTRNLPTGLERPADTVLGQARPVVLHGLWLDHAFRTQPEPDGRVRAALCRTDGSGTELSAGPWCCWLQIYTADPAHQEAFPGVRDGRALAVEPMTCPPNALSRNQDLLVLAPGESRSFIFGLRALTPSRS
ncbi:aldose 1-epimerase family protein [uncultured Mobiluncus sp.]|uniref:aldose 1-epimerase family protein n=1 Tax=uncultured Mobiluncus sp. TaxID=293425 RepID=UPI0025ECABAD|nr:aldose 1-epimerase family protein [uncultured Mobiluncus sp.]